MSDSLVRKYLAGSLPGLDKAVIMAHEAGVSLEWLATGNGSPSSHDHEARRRQESIDPDLLEKVIFGVKAKLHELNRELPPEAEARVIRLLYQLFAERDGQLDDRTLVDIVQLAAQ